MNLQSSRFALVAVAMILAAGSSAWRQGPHGGGAALKPKLAVLLIFDQLRGDYPTRWRDLFGTGGFRRLMNEGCWFSACHYPYAMTVTGAGHASLGTGCAPEKHGIIENDWWDREAAAAVYCATLPSRERVPPRADGKKKAQGYGSPERLLRPTLGEAVKEATGGKGKVVAISLKDRGAVLPAGRVPDAAVYWFDEGEFVTSTYYRDVLHPWAAAFNAEKQADRWFGKDWTKLRPDLDYAARSGRDDQLGEGGGVGQGRVFPHKMTGGLEKPGKKYYDALFNSPFGNDLMLAFGKRAVVAEKLGLGEAPDYLVLSFSSNDLVGHTWGPDSQEVLDMTLRTDLLIADLLNFLDQTVGKGNYVVGLSADHGVVPLPEVSLAKGLGGARIYPDQIRKRGEDRLRARFGVPEGKAKWIDYLGDGEFYLNHRLIKWKGIALAEVQEELAKQLRAEPAVQAVYKASQVAAGLNKFDPLAMRVQRTWHPERSGDVLAVMKPYHYDGRYLSGTGHGTPHPYDTHVPLMLYGPGVKAGERTEPATPLMLPVLLGQAIGVELKTADDQPPAGVFLR